MTNTTPNGQLADPATQLEGLQSLFTYLRDPGSFGADQGNLTQVLALLQSLGDFAKASQTAAPSAKILADKWQTVAEVVALLDFNLHAKGLLSGAGLCCYRTKVNIVAMEVKTIWPYEVPSLDLNLLEEFLVG